MPHHTSTLSPSWRGLEFASCLPPPYLVVQSLSQGRRRLCLCLPGKRKVQSVIFHMALLSIMQPDSVSIQRHPEMSMRKHTVQELCKRNVQDFSLKMKQTGNFNTSQLRLSYYFMQSIYLKTMIFLNISLEKFYVHPYSVLFLSELIILVRLQGGEVVPNCPQV